MRATEDYRLNLRLTSANQVTVSLGALRGSSPATSLSSTNPITIRAKVWLGSAPEPGAWTVTTTDAHPTRQGPGAVGLTGYLSGTATNAPVQLAVHRLVATP